MVYRSVTLQAVKDRAVWKLPELLQTLEVTPYRLHQCLEPITGTSRTTIYRWAKELPDTLDVALLMAIIHVLRSETGQTIQLHDILSYHAD